MPPNEETGRAAQLPPDRERDAGFRGEAFERAAWLFGLVFVAGAALVAVVLMARRRPKT